jgi:hypothetical protein
VSIYTESEDPDYEDDGFRDDEDECEGAPDPEDDDEDDDRWQEHKDGVAMGYIWPDGSYREPDEPDWGERDG